MFDFERLLSEIASCHILCIGDLILDGFVYGEAQRISPEAATPVLQVTRTESMVGGAGNVVRNFHGLGASGVFLSVVGDDHAGRDLKARLDSLGPRVCSHIMVDPERPTTHKMRFVSERHSSHLLRTDWEAVTPISPEVEDELIANFERHLAEADAVILSDYAKGVVTPRVAQTVISAARCRNIPMIVDPKSQGFSLYSGATILTPNQQEVARAVVDKIETDEQLAAAISSLCQRIDCAAILVTRGEKGMTLVDSAGNRVSISAKKVRVRDVSGAGDTVVATVACFLGIGASFEAAMRAANTAASIVVGKRGTATVSVQELRAQLIPAAPRANEVKIVSSVDQMLARLGAWRGQGFRVGFTNGCFDILHPGHVRLLARARAACDRLIVGLNTDGSVRRLKGPSRPLQSEMARAEVLASLEATDMIVFFDEDTPLRLIEQIKPSVLVKGSDYSKDQVVGASFVESNGGEVILVDIVPQQSTTRIIESFDADKEAKATAPR